MSSKNSKTPTKKRNVARSAKTGRFVRKSYARRHPNTTTVNDVAVTTRQGKMTLVRDKSSGKFVSKQEAIDKPDTDAVIVQVVDR